MTDLSLPLAGTRIVDLTRILAGPFATMRLADLGAEVVKVENPDGGDDTRTWGPPFVNGVSTYFFSVNRGKKSIAVDLKQDAGKRLIEKLLDGADVLIENFRPGALERLGFGWDALRERFPRLVYCSISGYGHEGAHRDKASYDVVVQGESGAMDVTGMADGPPTKFGLSIADVTAGLHAVEGILAALLQRGRTGRGDRVDVSLYDGMLSLLTYQAQMYLACGKAPRRLGNAHPSIVPYETFQAAAGPDGKPGFLNIGVGSDALWTKFCEALERPQWRDDAAFRTNALRVEARAHLVPLIQARLLERSAGDWYDRLTRAGVPCGLVRSVPDALAQAEADTRGMIVEVAHADAGRVRMVASPVVVGPRTAGRTAAPLPPPRLGEHTDEVLRAAGLDPSEIAAHRAKGTIA